MAPLISADGTPQRRVLEVAELVQIICSFLSKEDYIKILYLSHSIYACALPVVWEDVDLGLALRLIPGVEAKRANEDTPCSPYVISFPSTLDLSRFNVHVAFVKTLRSCRPYSIKFLHHWTSSGNRPFPNLRHIIVHSSGRVEAEHTSWISELLHPDILGLEFAGNGTVSRCTGTEDGHPWIGQEVCFNLIGLISCVCSGIRTLSLFPTDMTKSDKHLRTLAYKNLASLLQLRSLNFSGVAIHNELLETLGQLPHLNALSFCNDISQPLCYGGSPSSLPEDSFLSLQHLSLHGVTEFTMPYICEATLLFHRLVSVVIIFEDFIYYEDVNHDKRSILAVMSLGQNSPNLKNLTVSTHGNDGYFVISWFVIEGFKQMNLRFLDLGEVILDNGEPEPTCCSDDEDDEDRPPPVEWADFLSAVPHLEELRMERQAIKPHELRLLASALPNLRHLTIGTVPLGTAEPEGDEDVISCRMVLSSWSYFKAKKEVAEDEVPDANSVLNAAKFLYAIWSNVTCETHRLSWNYHNIAPHKQALAKLNEALETLELNDR